MFVGSLTPVPFVLLFFFFEVVHSEKKNEQRKESRERKKSKDKKRSCGEVLRPTKTHDDIHTKGS